MCGGGGSPAPLAPPPAVEDPEVQAAIRKERELARRRAGRQSTILTSAAGVLDSGKKTLLGG